MKFKAAAVQVTSTARVSNNLTKCRQLVEEAASAGAKVIGLPENFSFMGTEAEKKNLLGQIEEETTAFLKETAKDLGVYRFGGRIPDKGSNRKGIQHRCHYKPKWGRSISLSQSPSFQCDCRRRFQL